MERLENPITQSEIEEWFENGEDEHIDLDEAIYILNGHDIAMQLEEVLRNTDILLEEIVMTELYKHIQARFRVIAPGLEIISNDLIDYLRAHGFAKRLED